MEKTIVVFRKFKEGDVIALFPAEAWDVLGLQCASYQTIGQHSGAHYGHVMDITKAASAEEYSSLKAELERIGYNLVIRKRYHKNK